mgnify:CR=1 FL=1
MRLDVRLVDGVAQVHAVSGCAHPRVPLSAPGHVFDVEADPDLEMYVEDVPATLRDWVTADVHERVASTPDAGCDVEFYPCTGLVRSEPTGPSLLVSDRLAEVVAAKRREIEGTIPVRGETLPVTEWPIRLELRPSRWRWPRGWRRPR